MRYTYAVLLFLLVGIQTTACTDKLEDLSQVSKFRILGISADPPEIRPGEGTTLRALLADQNGPRLENVDLFWLVCAGSFLASDELDSSCEPLWLPQHLRVEEGGARYPILGVPLDILDEVVPEEYRIRGGEEAEEIVTFRRMSATALLFMCADGDLTMPSIDTDAITSGDDLDAVFEVVSKEMSGGLDDLGTALCPGGTPLVATKIMTISDAPQRYRNANPVLAEVSYEADSSIVVLTPTGRHSDLVNASDVSSDEDAFDGGLPSTDEDSDLAEYITGSEPSVFKCEGDGGCRDALELTAFVDGQGEQFILENDDAGSFDQELSEFVYITWFVSGGQFDRDRSGAGDEFESSSSAESLMGPFNVTWFPPREPGLHHLWSVAHDRRGGASWEHYEIRTEHQAQ